MRRRSDKMLIPGRAIVPTILKNVQSASTQIQPCGVDLSLKRIRKFTSAGSIDFDNSRRSISSSIIIPFLPSSSPEKKNAGSVQLEQGSYFVEFNETVEVPLDMMGLIYPRSSLFRAGATLVTGVVESGFCGPLGGLLMVGNTFGLRLFEGARLGQIVMQEMSEKVEEYRGVYQGKDFELERK